MARTKKAAAVTYYTPPNDPARTHPESYLAGQETARQLIRQINQEPDPGRVRFALRLVETHLATWPRNTGKNGLTDLQHARSRGFRNTLRDHLSEIEAP